MVIQQASVAERIGPIRSTVYGRVFNVISVPRAVNVAYTPLELKLHQDLMYLESSPGLQLLHCLKSDATGGESTVADGFKVPSSVQILIDGARMLTRMCEWRRLPASFERSIRNTSRPWLRYQ